MSNNQQMAYRTEQGESDSYLMSLWRRYLEHCADSEENTQGQVLVGSYHAAEIFGFLVRRLNPQAASFKRGEIQLDQLPELYWRADNFEDHLADGSMKLYANVSSLGEKLTTGNPEALGLIERIREETQSRMGSGSLLERSELALRASFPIFSLMTLVIDERRTAIALIRELEDRFISGAARATTAYEQIVNASYRIVEMMQLLVTLSDAELKDQVQQITARFQEEDQGAEPLKRVGNGFCRLFELGYLLTTHLDKILPEE